jgi:hypothetical protein
MSRQVITPGIGIEKAQAIVDAFEADRRNKYRISEISRYESLKVAIQRAKRTTLWTLPPKLPTANAPQRWKELPSLDTLEAYIGDRDAAERILWLMRTRAQSDAVTLEMRATDALY